jgi:hypothetical protein
MSVAQDEPVIRENIPVRAIYWIKPVTTCRIGEYRVNIA